VTVAVSGAVALVGVWLGKLWERQSSDSAWWRERRLAASTELLSRSQSFISLAQELISSSREASSPDAELPADQKKKHRVELEPRLASLYEQAMVVYLIAPNEVAQQGLKLYSAAGLAASTIY
jgi:hypothetical protein